MEAAEILPRGGPAKPGESPAVYVLLCADGSLYAGATTALGRRLAEHRRGSAARYTRSRLPVQLLAWWFPSSYDAARSQEGRFKALSRPQKLALLASGEAFGHSVHKPPYSHNERQRHMAHTPPQKDELPGYAQEAEQSQVRISTNKGDIVLRLFPDDAPMHSASFLKLAKSGFYDGLTFHRVEPGFVVQGGDPQGDGTGGPGYHLQAEFNARPHKRGTLAMARASDPDSAGSQFYICLDDARFLDAQYTVFGEMVDGFETLDAIRRGDVMKTVRVESSAS
jgi:cyclophilin family peptidyl-prolyl cis-trans isomerase/predicted GIY-YIG superfamily endonuclease